MRFLARFLALSVLCSLASAQSRFFWTATRDGGSSLDDAAHDLALGLHGEVFVAATTKNPVDLDARFIAYDAYGRTLWELPIGLGGQESAFGVAVDPSSGDCFGIGSSSNGGVHWAIWRISAATGAIVWQTDYFGPQLQGGNARDLAVDASGGVLVCGYTGSGAGQVGCLARFDSAGVLSWDRTFPVAGGQFGYAASLAVDPQGDVVVKSSAALGGTSWTLHRLTSAGAPVWSKPIGTTDNGVMGPMIDASSNLVYAINEPVVGGKVIAKLDSGGNPLWSVDITTLYGVNQANYGLAVDAFGNVAAAGSTGKVVRLDTNGNLLWERMLPPVAWFDGSASAPSGVVLGPGGDVYVRFLGHTTSLLDFDSVASWDAAGNFRWSQAVRGLEPTDEVRTTDMQVAPQGSVVIAGYLAPVGGTQDIFVAAVHRSSQHGCFGDGSSGPCPCGNTVAAGVVTGCRATTSFGVGARFDDQGISSLGSDSLRFFAGGLPPSGIALLLQGRPAAGAAPFQDGLLCLQGPLVRLYATPLVVPYLDLMPAGAARVHTRSAALGDAIQPGTSRGYQLYFRGGGTGLCQAGNGNLSNAVVVDWTP